RDGLKLYVGFGTPGFKALERQIRILQGRRVSNFLNATMKLETRYDSFMGSWLTSCVRIQFFCLI
ncbi:MAG: hypothetical protein JXQ81_09070, partial [Desulfuromonadales bacterium]|nr:hypothetical protein [Desulfuromonadales bacterium]MBN2792642.1 hypothetical protein [Desulfuromonadales bacterium]